MGDGHKDKAFEKLYTHTSRRMRERKKRSGSGWGAGEPLELRKSLNLDITQYSSGFLSIMGFIFDN